MEELSNENITYFHRMVSSSLNAIIRSGSTCQFRLGHISKCFENMLPHMSGMSNLLKIVDQLESVFTAKICPFAEYALNFLPKISYILMQDYSLGDIKHFSSVCRIVLMYVKAQVASGSGDEHTEDLLEFVISCSPENSLQYKLYRTIRTALQVCVLKIIPVNCLLKELTQIR